MLSDPQNIDDHSDDFSCEEEEIAVSTLLLFLECALEEVENEPAHNYDVEEILSYYNTLRTLFGFPIVHSISEADVAWLSCQHYELWKEEIKEMFSSETLIPEEQYRLLIQLTQTALESSETEDDEDANENVSALYPYNFLRELSLLAPADSIAGIDEAWLRVTDYQQWKKIKAHNWNSDDITPDEHQSALICIVEDCLEELEENPGNKEATQEALYGYNFLRELAGLPPIESIALIDLIWLKAYDYQLWQDRIYNYWSAENYTTSEEQLNCVFEQFECALKELKENPDDTYEAKELAFSYRFFRELLHLPASEAIDENWLKACHYQLWKDRIYEHWSRTDNFIPQIKQLFLVQIIEDSLTEADEDPEDTHEIRQVLYGYNFLREIGAQLPSIVSLNEIDRPKLTIYGYDLWKKMIRSSLESDNINIAAIKPYDIAQWAQEAWRNFAKNQADKDLEKQAFYKYNFLRERLRLSPILSSADMNQAWLDNVNRELKKSSFFE